MKRITHLPAKIAVSLIVLLYSAVLYLSPWKCPFLALTGIRCPGCGMTRALLCVLRFDFFAAFSHHFMFWSLPLLYLCFLLNGRLFNNKKLNFIFYWVMGMGFAGNWVMHQFF